MHLTKRQQEIYQYLKDHIHGKGYAPSIMEIGKQFNLSSPATVLDLASARDRKRRRWCFRTALDSCMRMER